MHTPTVLVFGGCNGVGKSTFAEVLCTQRHDISTFVNADSIARGLAGFDPESVALEAGRILLERLHKLAEKKQDFAFETTLAGRSYGKWLRSLREIGYRVHLCYFWLADPELNVARVLQRVRLGGHDIPAETIRKRWQRSLENFFALYRQLADFWEFWDNSFLQGPCLLARQQSGDHLEVTRQRLWQTIYRRGTSSPSSEQLVPLEEDGASAEMSEVIRKELKIHGVFGHPVACWEEEMVKWCDPHTVLSLTSAE